MGQTEYVTALGKSNWWCFQKNKSKGIQESHHWEPEAEKSRSLANRQLHSDGPRPPSHRIPARTDRPGCRACWLRAEQWLEGEFGTESSSIWPKDVFANAKVHPGREDLRLDLPCTLHLGTYDSTLCTDFFLFCSYLTDSLLATSKDLLLTFHALHT